MQGEYVIPSIAAIPKSAAEMALMQGIAGQGANSGPPSPFEQTDGRWRVQVSPSKTRYILILHGVQLTSAPESGVLNIVCDVGGPRFIFLWSAHQQPVKGFQAVQHTSVHV